jgi:hypothetical protein
MRYLFILTLCIVVLSGCKIFRSNLMLRTPGGFKYDVLIDSLSRMDYKIAANDAIMYKTGLSS